MLLLQSGNTALLLVILFNLLIVGAIVAGMWKTLSKANEPGWAALIPIYNVYKLLQIGGHSGLWVIGAFIPVVNILVGYVTVKGVAQSYGQGLGFALGLWFLSFIFFPLLGFGDYDYHGPSGVSPGVPQ